MNCISSPASYIYVWIYIWNNHINHMRLTPMNAKMYTGIVVIAHPKEHSLFVKFIQPSYPHVFWALFNDRIIVYAPSTRFPHLKSILMELVYKITRYLGFEGCVVLTTELSLCTGIILIIIFVVPIRYKGFNTYLAYNCLPG